tara:strand:- start:365 stop:592 length:228 start_codon:yes stop_codon:yes gene_type:complete
MSEGWTYKTEEHTYAVDKLPEEAKALVELIINNDQEVRAIRRRLAILEAAAIKLNESVRNHLDDSAIIEEDSGGE